jgi:hypothetical protein
MKGYIYVMFGGADPSVGWEMNDPIFGNAPTMGACRPDIRRAIEQGDYIFPISGSVRNVKPHVVGAMAVDEKINALAAYRRFPQHRMRENERGQLIGNITVDERGRQVALDYHDNHLKRIENYIVGRDAIYFDDELEMQQAKQETVDILNEIFKKDETKVHKIIGRCRRMNERQVRELLDWMSKIKQAP